MTLYIVFNLVLNALSVRLRENSSQYEIKFRATFNFL